MKNSHFVHISAQNTEMRWWNERLFPTPDIFEHKKFSRITSYRRKVLIIFYFM